MNELVTSLELSKELKELGVPQKSIFYWEASAGTYSIEYGHKLWGLFVGEDGENHDHDSLFCSAFLSDELGKWLPHRIRPIENDYWLWQTKLKHGSVKIGYYSSKFEDNFYCIEEGTESEARGKMLVHLLKNGLVKKEDLK